MARSRKRPARSATAHSPSQIDPRLIAAEVVTSESDVANPGDWVVVASPVRLSDDRLIVWYPPQAVAFNLIEAKKYCTRGARQRRAIMGNLGARNEPGTYQPANPQSTLDCIADLSAAVLFSFAAIESLANHVIDMLPDETTVVFGKRELAKADLVRHLGIEDKFKRVVPLLDGAKAIAGDSRIWERFQSLKFLRDELVHVKERGYDADPEVLTAYDRLIVGEADDSADDARDVVDGAYPGFIPDRVARVLDSANAD